MLLFCKKYINQMRMTALLAETIKATEFLANITI